VTRIRVHLPQHLRTLARVDGEVWVEVRGAPTIRSVVDALEERYPPLRGTIRDHDSGERRAYMRYFAGGQDLSHDPPDSDLPGEVTEGRESFRVLGAIAGG
jgi:sulfur-carrier protein